MYDLDNGLDPPGRDHGVPPFWTTVALGLAAAVLKASLNWLTTLVYRNGGGRRWP